MNDTWIIVGISLGYLLLSLVMGIVPGLKVSKSSEGYVAGDRSMNLLLLYFVLGASIFSSFAFLGGPGWATLEVLLLCILSPTEHWEWYPSIFLVQEHVEWASNMAILHRLNYSQNAIKVLFCPYFLPYLR